MMRLRLLAAGVLLALAAPSAALARGEFDPSKEFEQHEWLPIHLGPLNLSITKAVAYLLIGSAVTILLGIALMRVKTPGRRQAVGEQIYEIAQTQVAEQGLPHKAIGRWFPYVASLMLFIWVVNMLAGHMLILTFIGLMFVLENVFLAVVVVPAATAFYLFEVVIVVSIQAFIFAALSAIYIGSAIEPEH